MYAPIKFASAIDYNANANLDSRHGFLGLWGIFQGIGFRLSSLKESADQSQGI